MPSLLKALEESTLPPELLDYLRQSEEPELFGDSPPRGTPSFPRNLGKLAAFSAECQSGLLLFAGDLHGSHALSQNIHNREGSFWHGVMHRRERDFWNAKYWFRKVGHHPVMDAIATALSELPKPVPPWIGSTWDPYHFVDLCEAVSPQDTDQLQWLRRLAWIEWQTLFLYCYEL